MRHIAPVRCVASLLVIAALSTGSAAADVDRWIGNPPVPLAIPGAPLGDPQGVVASCRLATRVFRTFAAGAIDYCRGHLRFAPGTLDCFQIADELCAVYLPGSREWVETRRPLGPSVFPCPAGPEPPVCPRLTLQ